MTSHPPHDDEPLADESPAEEPLDVDIYAPPPPVHTAIRLMRAGALFSIVGLVVGLLSSSAIKDKIATNLSARNQLTQATLDGSYHFVLVNLVVGAIAGAAIWLWMARANSHGRSWARTLATFLAVFNVLDYLLVLGRHQATFVQLLVSAVNLVLAVIIVVLLWRRESSDFYFLNSRRRRA